MQSLPVNEIFYSLQGEGGQMGRAMLFVRLSGCNLACDYCDTDFAGHRLMSATEILEKLQGYPCRDILWTGGEPTLALREEHIAFFHEQGYRQSIETNGTRPVPRGLDYVTCSPKAEAISGLRERFVDNYPNGIDEVRWPLQLGAPLPPPIEQLVQARRYYVSPVEETGVEMSAVVARCMDFVLAHPEWRLSVQLHKLLGFR